MKTTTILINGSPFTYQDEVGDPFVYGSMSVGEMDSLLKFSTKLLDDCGISFFLAFGTLLGAVRESNFIKGDSDVDIIVTDEKKLYISLPYLWEHGLCIDRIFEEELYSFHSEARHPVDFYIMRTPDHWMYKKWCVSIRGFFAPKRFFQTIVPDGCQLGDQRYPCPQNPERLLEWWYGKTWRIPQSKKATEDVLLRRIEKFPSKLLGKMRKKLKKMGRDKS